MSDIVDDNFEELPNTGLPAGKFPLGQVLIAADTAYELDRAFVEECLRRHASGDWGEANRDVKIENGRTLRGEGVMPLVSRFRVGDRILQIVTKADGTVTSIVLFDTAASSLPPDPELPVRFDAYEIHGVVEFSDGKVQVPDEDAESWGVFGHVPGEGLVRIGEFETPERAEEIYARITGRSSGSRP